MHGSVIIDSKKLSLNEFSTITLPNEWNWLQKSQQFIREWLSNTRLFELKTSGSSGAPKKIEVSRKQMETSALATIEALKLSPPTTALLCMNPNMIGGRMMLVRAMLGNWDLQIISPERSPIAEGHFNFTAMVPLQVESLMNTPEGIQFLNRIEKLIIGGAAVSESLMEHIQNLKTEVYQTFGMTETVSHIALRKLNGNDKSESYQLLGDNDIKTDDKGLLSIKGSVTHDKWIHTNDIVELTEHGFKWLGRADLIVNSGGIKVHIQALEAKIKEMTGIEVLVWKKEDKVLGEMVIGMIRTQADLSQIQDQASEIKESLPKYHFPKEWRIAHQWQITHSGKIDRRSTLSMTEQKK